MDSSLTSIQKREKRVTVKLKGRPVEMVREQYLRGDISCQSSLCHRCVLDSKRPQLPSDVTHYLIPFMDIALKYMEILECSEIRGIIFSQTVMQKVIYDGGKSLVNRVNKSLQDPRKECVVFLNEICIDTYLSRNASESLPAWNARNIYHIGKWYSFHLGNQIPIVLVTENEEIISSYENETPGVYVISLHDYLHQFWPDLQICHDIYESLTALLSMEPILESYGGFRDYLSTEVLETGLRNGFFHEGKLKVNKHHAKDEAFVIPLSLGKTTHGDVLISGIKDRNRAIHGDLVYVEILSKSSWKGRLKQLGENERNTEKMQRENAEIIPTGRIVGIKQRNWRDYVACLPQTENFNKKLSQDRILVIPYDCRIPKIRIVTRQASSLENNRIVVRIDSWNVNSQYPNGHFVRSIGKIGDMETESMTLMLEHNINILPFPSRVSSEMPVATGQESLKVIGRRDLRQSHLICSIDPKGCEDVDDALSVRHLSDGCMELGVHIADVTNYVLPNSFTDLEARDRATTVYLAEKRFDMLPSVLSSNLCSLLSNVDRFAVTILWTLDEDCKVIDVWFGRTVIRSSYKLYYELAQEIIYGEGMASFAKNCPEVENSSQLVIEERFHQLKTALENLTRIAHILKARRLSEGALELESNEVQFEFEEIDKSRIADVKAKEALDIHETVAECMIFANQWVAKKLYDVFPTKALLRHHPEPRQEQFEHLRLLAQVKNFELDTTSNKMLAQSLRKCVDPCDPTVNKLMRLLTIHAMRPAEYISTGSCAPDDYYHYGLALNYYTHFTSPIRRYADILVHRLLLATADENFSGSGIIDNNPLQDVCDHINERHAAAKQVQQLSRALFQSLYFTSLPPDDDRSVTDAIIYAVRANGVLVYTPQYGVKGPVYLVNKEHQVAFVTPEKVEWTVGQVKFDKCSFSVVAAGYGTQIYKLLNHITVRIVVVNCVAHSSTIRLDLLNYLPHPDWRKTLPEANFGGKAPSQFANTRTKNINIWTEEKRLNGHKKLTRESLYMVIENLRDLALSAVDT